MQRLFFGSRRTARKLATGIAGVCLLSQVFVYAHLLLVRHQTCPVHGELIDSSGAAQAPADAAKPATQRRPTAQLSAGERDVHRHDHCGFVLQRRDHPAAAQSRVAPAVPPDHRLNPYSLPAHRLTARIALFRIAPKQSPPA